MSPSVHAKPCEIWRKSRIAARILRRHRAGVALADRYLNLAGSLSRDASVTERLIAQAHSSLAAHDKLASR